ncbi:MAG: SDR family oxidoreductase [Kiritimatiellia bacterium]|nr:SDR family oxidoreductase [Kiritimatiellia bacterium]
MQNDEKEPVEPGKTAPDNPPLILVTGATGYIGGRLVPRLIEQGYRIRCLVRDTSRLQGRSWQNTVDIVEGDVLQPDTLAPAMRGVRAAYYLIHSLGAGSGFHQRDLNAARHFGAAACAAGVERILYLGGLAEASPELSEHLRSRQQTGDFLRRSGVPVTEFRAGVIVGSGSLSFEMIRYLTERVPVMVCPRWVYTRTQPIGIGDVLEYLTAALSVPESGGRILEIGGAEIVTYGEMMTLYAAARGLKRWMVPVPVLTPRLSSYWVNLVTPIPAAIARPLIQGLRSESVIQDQSARRLFPGIDPVGYRVAVERALAGLQASDLETTWSDALRTSQGDVPPVILTTQEGMIRERRQRVVAASPAEVYRTFMGLGGARGWLYMNWAWRLRGLMDRMIGGVGLRRGRRDPDTLRVGDALDFWRVEAVEPERKLRLRAEMKMPGKAWLQFEVTPRSGEQSLLAQTAFFAPKGLMGWMYWYGLYPFHGLIFSGLIDQIAQRAITLNIKPSESAESSFN